MVSALPAFVIGVLIVRGLGRLGVNEVRSFLISMPVLIFAWFYFVGWLIDRLKSRRTQRA
jgi:high-affinity Fe2+/Pb2+ permease